MNSMPRALSSAASLAFTLALVASSLAFVALGATAAAADSCADRTRSELLVPSCGAWLGSTDRNVDQLDLATQERVLGAQLDLVRIYKVGPGAAFFTQHENELISTGHRLVYSWKVSTQRTDLLPWQQVARGDHDDALRRVASQIANSGTTVMFALHHEPEDDLANYGSNADYVAMYRHVHEVMEPIAGNSLVWFINYMGHSFGGLDQVAAMYPGDDIIDWISYNPYNWRGCHAGAPWHSFADQARPFYQWAQQNHPAKPLMIGETATNELPGAGNAKANWIDAMANSVANEFPQIRAVLWFHQSQNSGFCDRRWDSSASSVAAFARLRANPHFGGRSTKPAPVNPPATPPPPTRVGTPPTPRVPVTCSVQARSGGLQVTWHARDSVGTYVYRLDTAGRPSRYGEISGGSGFVGVPAGQTVRVSLSAKFAENSYSPAGNCGLVTAPPIVCSVAARPGGVTAGWSESPGAEAYVYKVSVGGLPDRYYRVATTWGYVALPAGTNAEVIVSAVLADGSYTRASPCGSARAGQ